MSKPSQGFTLPELAVTLAVIALTLTAGVPSFRGLIQSTRLSSATNDFRGAVALARSEAIKRASTATLCAVEAGDWRHWRIGAGAEDEDIRVGELAGPLALTGPEGCLSYGAMGESQGGAVDFVVCDGDSHQARNIYITPAGRVSISEGIC